MFQHCVRVLGLGLGAIGLATGCADPTGPGRELELARQRWADRGPASYSITIGRLCECLEHQMGPVRVVVTNGAVTLRINLYNGQAMTAGPSTVFPDIPGVFALIDSAVARGAAITRLRFDPAFGFLLSAHVDFHPEHVDDEVLYTFSQFTPR